MRKIALAAVAATMICGSADAALLLFTITGNYAASFTLDSNPTPIAFTSSTTTFNPVPGVYKLSAASSASSAARVDFYSSEFGGGLGLTSGGHSAAYYGLQLYTGSTSSPVFAAGTFDLTDNGGLLIGKLVISGATSAPEPATWAMMIVGFGAIGSAMRRRQPVTISFG